MGWLLCNTLTPYFWPHAEGRMANYPVAKSGQPAPH